MKRFPIYLALMLAAWLAGAADYKLKDGTTMSGEGISFTDKGVVIKNADNKVLPRTAWTNFAVEGLKEFAKNPKARPFVELLPDMQEANDAAAAAAAGTEPAIPEAAPPPPRAQIKVNEVTGRPVLPENIGLFGGMFGEWFGRFLLLIAYAAIIYAGYEVAVFRRRPRNLVMGLSAIPFLGIAAPITFLILPAVKNEEEAKPTAVQQALAKAKEEPKAEEKPMPGKRKSGLSFGKKAEDESHGAAAAGPKPVAVAKPGATAPAAPAAPAKPAAPAAPKLEAAVYRRGETNINKRFIETKFAGFFKAVLGPAEKEMWLVWVTATGGEYWSKRIVSISQTEVVVNCPQEGGGTLDQTVQIVEIQEIHLRPQEG
jgi:hypothetical protein